MGNTLYTVRTPDGLELGPVRAETVVDLILTKKILGNETVSEGGGEWVALKSVDEFRRAVDKREGKLDEGEDEPISAAAQTDLDDLPPPPGEKLEISLDDTVPASDVEEAEEILENADLVEDDRIDLGDIEDALEDAHLPTNPPAKPVQVPPAAKPAAAKAAPAPAATDLSDGGIEIDLGDDDDDVLEAEPIEEEVLELEPLELAGVQELEVLEVKPKAAKPATDVRAELKNPENRYTIRNSDGLVLGPVRVATLRDLIQAGAVAVTAEIQKNTDPWKPLASVPELLYLYDQIKSEA